MDTYEKLSTVFSSVLMEIVSTISGFSLEILSPEDSSAKEYDFDEMIGVMALNGKKSGILFLSAKETDMRKLCSYMIGVPQEEITKEDVEDSLCELVNMTAGSAKLRLSGSDFIFNLSSPFLLKGQNMSIKGKNKTHIISQILGNDEISVRVKVVY